MAEMITTLSDAELDAVGGGGRGKWNFFAGNFIVQSNTSTQIAAGIVQAQVAPVALGGSNSQAVVQQVRQSNSIG